MPSCEPKEALEKIQKMKKLMLQVSSAEFDVSEKEAEYAELQQSLTQCFDAMRIANPNNFETLLKFHGYYRSKMQTEEQRKDLPNKIYEQAENQIKVVLKRSSESRQIKEHWTPIAKTLDSKKVFVVYGRNEKARVALFTLLRAVGLQPSEWTELLKATQSGSPFIGQVLEKGFSEVQAVVVLMTPDDEGKLRDKFKKMNDGPSETQLTPQARLNVIFEAGMAFGYCPDRTIIIELGSLRPLSDISGRHVLRFHDIPEKRHELIQRLLAVHCAVNTSGTDWLSAGDFTIE